MTSAVVVAAARRLAAAGVASPRVDADLIAARVLGVERGRLLLAEEMTEVQRATFDELVTRRVGREPLQHILGSAPFGPIELAVGPGVFVPRPETELLLEWAVTACDGIARPHVVDLCSGSGALAIAVATMVATADVTAVENSTEALIWLRRNVSAADESVARRLSVVEGDVCDGHLLGAESVDVVVSNPPYVPDGVAVSPEVAVHDPAVAVFGGADGMAIITPMIDLIARILVPGGRTAIEHDDATADLVVAVLRRSGAFHEIEAHTDLAGRPRFVSARRIGASPDRRRARMNP